MSDHVLKGSTNVSLYFNCVDSDGAPATGLTIANLDIQYTRLLEEPAAKVDLTALADQDTAHTDNYAIAIDDTSSPGLVRVDLPDAAFANGAASLVVCLSGTGIKAAMKEIILDDGILFVDLDGIPKVLTNPKESTDTFTMEFQIFDHNGVLIAPGTGPTVTLVDQDLQNVAARLNTTTPSAVATGRYQVTYTANTSHAAAKLTFGVTCAKTGYVGGTKICAIDLQREPLAKGETLTFTNAVLSRDEVVAIT